MGRGAYLGAKALAYSLLALLSLAAGLALAAYYTEVLLKPVDYNGVLRAYLLYTPNLVLAGQAPDVERALVGVALLTAVALVAGWLTLERREV